MATPKTVWGIDIGQCALKALKLREVDGELQVEAFDIIEHPKILSQPDADRRQLIRNALEQFLARNNIAGSTVAVAVPGQSSFTRFVKLPPVETKKIPDIVRFEAEQQIPFPINDVIWRWQTFQDPDNPDVEVGIFAMKKVDISDALSHFSDVELAVDVVQMAPLALYNYLSFDGGASEEGATLLADVGADKTDLVVIDGSRLWTRTIQIGGNNFTDALVKAFKLSFPKAEKLKRTAATSKYARQVFQAMRPVFADLVQEIQRSIGFYTSLHRESRFRKLVGLGNGFRLPGLQKYLEQNLNIPVVRLDNYNKLSTSPIVNAPTFTENMLSFGVAYGLALQGLGMSVVSTNLLPSEVASKRTWAKKNSWFAAAAIVLLVTLVSPLYRAIADRSALQPGAAFAEAQKTADVLTNRGAAYRKAVNDGQKERQELTNALNAFGYRGYWATLLEGIGQAASSVSTVNANGENINFLKLNTEFGQAATAEARKKVIDKIKSVPRGDRRMIIIDSIDWQYAPDLSAEVAAAAAPSATPAGTAAAVKPSGAARGFRLRIIGHTPLPKDKVHTQLVQPFINKCATLKVDNVVQVLGGEGSGYTSMGLKGGVAAAAAATADPTKPRLPDPLIPEEDMSNDTYFEISMNVLILGDGLPGKLEQTAKP